VSTKKLTGIKETSSRSILKPLSYVNCRAEKCAKATGPMLVTYVDKRFRGEWNSKMGIQATGKFGGVRLRDLRPARNADIQ
jgi:hypothetical protein